MLFKKLSTVERVYNIGLEDNSLAYLFENITHFVFEAQEDLIKLYDLRVLEKIPVKDIMTKDMIVINENDNIGKLRQYIDKYRHMGYPVVEGGVLVGSVCFNDIRDVNDSIKVRDIMTPPVVVSENTDFNELLYKMHDADRVYVVDGSKLKGIISKTDIIRILKLMGLKNDLQK